ncbi:hypothetical protein [Pleomorphomonas oryzae]|uniref:hypothetical protein n=1 Tax=Pleomorphomonas oryzae TaxID=261934 RepID=UPI00047E3826|nr:hypothetical protein [Pleomorphomonas oryzae]
MAMKNYFPPDEPLNRKMTPAQEDLLRRVVRTNGGGVSGFREKDSVIDGLMKRGMIQGKRGQEYMIVHTKRGLQWVRDNPPKPKE